MCVRDTFVPASWQFLDNRPATIAVPTSYSFTASTNRGIGSFINSSFLGRQKPGNYKRTGLRLAFVCSFGQFKTSLPHGDMRWCCHCLFGHRAGGPLSPLKNSKQRTIFTVIPSEDLFSNRRPWSITTIAYIFILLIIMW